MARHEVRVVSDEELASRSRGQDQILFALPLIAAGIYIGFVAAERLGHPVFGIVCGLAATIGLPWLVLGNKLIRSIYGYVIALGFGFLGFIVGFGASGEDFIWAGFGLVVGLAVGFLYKFMGEFAIKEQVEVAHKLKSNQD